MSNNKDTMTPARWHNIKTIGLSAPRYLHVSCEARMIPKNPLDPHSPLIPWVSRGETYKRQRVTP